MNTSDSTTQDDLGSALRELRVAGLVAVARRQGLEHVTVDEARQLAVSYKSDFDLYHQIAGRRKSKRATAFGKVLRLLQDWFRSP